MIKELAKGDCMIIDIMKEFISNLVDRLLTVIIMIASILLLCLPATVYFVLILCNVIQINGLVAIVVCVLTVLWFLASFDTLDNYHSLKKRK